MSLILLVIINLSLGQRQPRVTSVQVPPIVTRTTARIRPTTIRNDPNSQANQGNQTNIGGYIIGGTVLFIILITMVFAIIVISKTHGKKSNSSTKDNFRKLIKRTVEKVESPFRSVGILAPIPAKIDDSKLSKRKSYFMDGKSRGSFMFDNIGIQSGENAGSVVVSTPVEAHIAPLANPNRYTFNPAPMRESMFLESQLSMAASSSASSSFHHSSLAYSDHCPPTMIPSSDGYYYHDKYGNVMNPYYYDQINFDIIYVDVKGYHSKRIPNPNLRLPSITSNFRRPSVASAVYSEHSQIAPSTPIKNEDKQTLYPPIVNLKDLQVRSVNIPEQVKPIVLPFLNTDSKKWSEHTAEAIRSASLSETLSARPEMFKTAEEKELELKIQQSQSEKKHKDFFNLDDTFSRSVASSTNEKFQSLMSTFESSVNQKFGQRSTVTIDSPPNPPINL